MAPDGVAPAMSLGGDRTYFRFVDLDPETGAFGYGQMAIDRGQNVRICAIGQQIVRIVFAL